MTERTMTRKTKASFRLLCIWLVAVLQTVCCGEQKIVKFNHDAETSDADADDVEPEFFTIYQITQITRRKRDAVDHVVFPQIMEFTLNFIDRDVHLRLKRNAFMTSHVILSDQSGPLQHDLGRKTGIYQDLDTRSSFLVLCEDFAEHCSLRGTMQKDGRMLEILPEPNEPQLHRAITSSKKLPIISSSRKPQVPGTIVVPENETSVDYWPRSNPKFVTKRKKRAIPTGCDIVECYAIVDETVWAFFLSLTGGNTTAAEEEITAEYLALYTQADLHFDFVSTRKPGACIRLYLSGVHIQKTSGESWSFGNQIQTGFVNAVPGLVTCGAQGNAFRSSYSIDLTQCYTRRDIVWNENAGNIFFAVYRSLAFQGVACDAGNQQFTSSIVEAFGEKVELLIAKEVSVGLGAAYDSDSGCVDSDGYIMAKLSIISPDELKYKNAWFFSTCTLDLIEAYINSLTVACLSTNAFNDTEYDAFRNRTLAGMLYSWEQQCVQRFGVGSVRCDPSGQNRTFFSDMCGAGIFCTSVVDGTCSGQNRPYDGTPCGDLDAYCLKGECFIPSRQLGINCTNLNDCADSNATCDANSNTCQCSDGYYDDNSDVVGGTCQPKVSVGEACPQNDSCLDPNAFCDGGTCACLTGYYNETGSCFLLKYIGQNCSFSAQCNGDNVECSGSPSTCRCLSDRYLDFATGNCVSDKTLGDACDVGQCGPENSVCDSTTNICKCQEGFYDANGATAGGNCSAKVALNATCPQPDACSDPNAVCSGTCGCASDYYENSGTCEPLKCVGENCTGTDQCRGSNVECSGSPSTCRCPSDRYLDIGSGDCVLNKDLGSSCEPGQCGPADSVCDSTTNVCECQEGFYDSNGATAAGNCSAKVALNATCPQPDACSDPNAVCSGTCGCASDYYENSGTCEPLKCVGENCTGTDQCRGSNVECSGSPSTCRCPSDRYLDIGSGDCVLNKDLGSSCEPGQCGPADSVCDSTTNVCECQEGFYDSNGATAAGNCSAKVALNATCLQPDACSDPNAVCSGTCGCTSDYYENSGTCEPLKCVGENCTGTDQCRGDNVECSGSPATCRCPSDRYHDITTGNCVLNKNLGDACEDGQCGPENSVCDSTNNTCRCQLGFYDTNGIMAGGNCSAKLALNVSCTQSDACEDANAICSGTCTCDPDYFENSGTCEPLKCVGENCTGTDQCRGENVECSGRPSTCRCPSDRYLDIETGNCVSKKDLGSSCEPGQCGPADSVCDSTTNVCECQEGFYDGNGATAAGNCSAKVALNATCPQPDACSDPYAVCSGTCGCASDYYENSGTCEPLKCVGENCTGTDQCRGSNVECSGSPSTCRCPSDRYLDIATGDCVLNKDLGSSCEPGQCGPADSVCDSTTNVCECQEGFYDSNGATAAGNCSAKVALNATCPQPDACSDPNAVCSGTCGCASDYYENSGTCEPLKCVGENCTGTDQCRGSNVECSGSPSTCRCSSDRYLDIATGDCVLNKDLGSSCEPGQCGPANSVCDSTTNVCECQEGFYDSNGATAAGNCSAKVALNATCPQPDACSDPNAVCSGTCGCASDYYENSGTCEPLKCVGENCTGTDQCRGSNVECSGSPSTCRCPSDRYLDIANGDCVLNKDLGSSCEPGQCGPADSVCDSTTNVCECQEGFYDSNGAAAAGNCSAKVALNATCPQPDACSDPNAVCSGTCGCASDYYENSGTCEPLKCVGENCTGSDQCRGSNVECSGSPSTCRCPSDRYLDIATGDCVFNKDLGSSCEPGQCGPADSVCDSTTNVCECQEGFYDSNGATAAGNCSAKVALNATCPQPDACSDPNAVCSGTCGCASDYYENSGTCEPLKCVGENCTGKDQCRGSNVECSGSPSTCRCPSDRYLDIATGDCDLNKDLGSSCEPGQCGPADSVCDSTTNVCDCQEGFYDSNGATAAGNCSAKVALNATCPQPDACSDPNAVCSGTCGCASDYYENSGTCEPLKCVGENCTGTDQCRGSNVECSGSPSTCRCSSDRYLDIATGDCVLNKDLGSSCEPGQCGPADSVCDSTTNVCECQEGFYDSNGATAVGNCSAKVALNATCPQPDACSDPNAVCSGTCGCASDYYENSGTCEPLKCVGENCTGTDQCRGSNVECSGSPSTCRCPSDRYLDIATGDCVLNKDLGSSCEPGQCGPADSVCDSTTNVCECQEGFYDSNGATAAGNCSAKVALNATCPQPDACSDPNAVCSGTCGCASDYYENSGTCEPLKCVGENCTGTDQCRGSNVECSGSPSTCRCPSDRYLDIANGDCVLNKDLGSSCEPGQCGPADSVCDSTTNVCECQEGFYDSNGATAAGNCSAKVALNATCPQPDACSDPNAVCSGTCGCASDYYENSGTCEPLKCVGENCTGTDQCRGSNVECSGSPSTCRCPSDRYLDIATGDCVLNKDLGSSCEPGQCGPADSVCDSTTNVCECQEGFYDSNGATAAGNCSAKVALNATCPQPDACSDPNAVCSGTCGCASDYYENSGTCEPLKCVGENCTGTDQCRGSNVECSGSPSTCRCPSDRYLDISTGDCVLKLAINETCERGQCLDVNAICQPSSNSCECADGFRLNITTCVPACPSNDWEEFGNSCYLFGETELFYSAAVTFCDGFDTADDSSTLVQVDTIQELNFLKDFMTNRTTQPTFGYWNDLFQTTTNGNETWRNTGDPLVVSDWRSGQPDDFGGSQSCTMFFKTFSYQQADINCVNNITTSETETRTAFALCEIILV